MENPNKLAKCKVLCAGEALIDIVTDNSGTRSQYLGGAVYNLARALALQGIDVGYLNPLSSDVCGQDLRAQLVEDGVVVFESESVTQSTSLAIATLDVNGKAAYSFYREGVADRATTSERLNQLSQMTTPQLVCTGCLALSPADASIYLPWLAAQKRLGIWIAIDVNVRAEVMKDQDAYKANIYKALQYADIIKASDDDLAYLDISASALLAKTNASLLLLTLGSEGAQLLTRQGDGLKAQAPRGLQVVDTVGAGDCFFAGFLAQWLQNSDDLQKALDHAVKCASWSVTRQGCQPPTRDDAANFTTNRPPAP